MGHTAWDEFWWNNITGARTIVEQVAMSLMENKIVALKVPSDLPWRHSMRSEIQTAFNERSDVRGIIIESVDAVDDGLDAVEPGQFILQRYALPSVRTGYRAKARKTIQSYLSECHVLHNRIIWVKGLGGQTARKWAQFCRGFAPKTAEEGLFVLEFHGELQLPESKCFAYIDFDQYVSDYDVQLFNSFLLEEERRYSDVWKRYISAAAAVVCGVDAEVSERLLLGTDFHTDTIIEGLQRVADSGDFDLRGMEQSSGHPLWYLRNHRLDELSRRIWTAQIQVLFPMIELERRKLIEKWWASIRDALSMYRVEQFGVVLRDPAEVELGTLSYMMRCKVAADKRMLYVPDEADRQRICFLHNCRNKLAHMNCCTPSEVSTLLDHSLPQLSEK